MSTYYPDSIQRSIEEKLGDIPSILDYGALSDGSGDSSPAIQRAVDSLAGEGSSLLHAPAGNYIVSSQIDFPSNLTFFRDGDATVFFRGTDADLPSEKAMFSI